MSIYAEVTCVTPVPSVVTCANERKKWRRCRRGNHWRRRAV